MPTVTQAFSSAHPAEDYASPCSTALGAPFDGTVIAAVPGLTSYGNRVWIRSKADPKICALVAHMAAGSIAVVPGQRVTGGQYIGRSGNTGHVCSRGECYSSGAPKGVGCHVHFAIKSGGVVTPGGIVGGVWRQPASWVGKLFSPSAIGRAVEGPDVVKVGGNPLVPDAIENPARAAWTFVTFGLPQYLKIGAGGFVALVGFVILLVMAGQSAPVAQAIQPAAKAAKLILSKGRPS